VPPEQDGDGRNGSAAAASTSADAIAAGVADVVRAALGVGAALARSVTRAVESGESEPSRPGTGPLGDLVRDSLEATGGVVRVIVRGIGVTGRAVAVPLSARRDVPSAAVAQASHRPRVHAGSTLRVPLAVENAGSEPLTEMHIRCQLISRLEGAESPEGEPLATFAIRFEPSILTVGPRDFEKLTVYVDVPARTAPGCYRADITDDSSGFEATLDFDVVSES
jgi:hypothetical protein